MFSPFLILWMVFAHWVADFVCQTHWQASNKSKNYVALSRHVLVYTACMAAATYPFVAWPDHGPQWLVFVVVTFIAHFVTDDITSKITSKLFMGQFEKTWIYDRAEDGVVTVLDWRWAMKPKFNPHWFFVVIGFDQFLHYAQLFLTLAWVMS